MEKCLEKTTDEEMKTKVREVFQQGMADALKEKRWMLLITLENRIPEENVKKRVWALV
jgi:hypothetical protein